MSLLKTHLLKPCFQFEDNEASCELVQLWGMCSRWKQAVRQRNRLSARRGHAGFIRHSDWSETACKPRPRPAPSANRFHVSLIHTRTLFLKHLTSCPKCVPFHIPGVPGCACAEAPGGPVIRGAWTMSEI